MKEIINRARRERQVWRSGGFFITIRDTEYPYKYVRSFANRGREPVGVRGSAWASIGREIIGRVDRHSIVTRARPSERRSVRAVRFFSLIFFTARSFSRRTDGRTERAIDRRRV